MKQFEIYFDWGELLVEVAAETFHRGKVIENGENYRLLHELMATEDNKVHVEKLWGSATKAFGELGRAVGEYVCAVRRLRPVPIHRVLRLRI